MEYRKMYFHDFITRSTQGSASVVDLGAGLFERMYWFHPDVKQRIGIEIFQPYIDSARYHDCIKICGDVMNYRELLKGHELDTAFSMDLMEHITREDGLKLIAMLKEDFKKVIIIAPCGDFPQDEDVLGFGNHTYQTHRSVWRESDFESLGFTINIVDPTFHSTPERLANHQDIAAYFGVWEREKSLQI